MDDEDVSGEDALEVDPSATELEQTKKELTKARKEAAKYRIEARQAKVTAEFGETVAGFVPKDLSLDEAREYAQNLKAAFSPEGEATPEAHASQEAPTEPEAPNPLAAVSQPSVGTESSARLTAQQIYEEAQSNPTRAVELLRAQRDSR